MMGVRVVKMSKVMELMKMKLMFMCVGMKEIEVWMVVERNVRYFAASRGSSGGGASAGKFVFDMFLLDVVVVVV